MGDNKVFTIDKVGESTIITLGNTPFYYMTCTYILHWILSWDIYYVAMFSSWFCVMEGKQVVDLVLWSLVSNAILVYALTVETGQIIVMVSGIGVDLKVGDICRTYGSCPDPV